MGIWKETAAVSAAALLGLFLLPWALTQGPVKAAELPEAQAAAPPPQEEGDDSGGLPGGSHGGGNACLL